MWSPEKCQRVAAISFVAFGALACTGYAEVETDILSTTRAQVEQAATGIFPANSFDSSDSDDHPTVSNPSTITFIGPLMAKNEAVIGNKPNDADFNPKSWHDRLWGAAITTGKIGMAASGAELAGEQLMKNSKKLKAISAKWQIHLFKWRAQRDIKQIEYLADHERSQLERGTDI